MQISVSVQVNEDENFSTDQNEAAEAVLEALGGNPETDSCYVNVSVARDPGMAGVAAAQAAQVAEAAEAAERQRQEQES